MRFLRRQSVKSSHQALTNSQKRTIDKAVKKTVDEYKKTLDLLAKT